MKKVFMISALLLVSAIGATARDTELSVGYGAFPAMKSMGVYHNHWQGLDCWGSANFTIDHRFAPALWIGMGYTYSSADSDRASDGRYGKVTWHGLMVNVRYEWHRSGSLMLYSHVGLGALVEYYSPAWEDSYNRTNFAFQVSPLGVQFDILPQVGFFAEAGYGVHGVVKAGIRMGF